MIEKDQTLSGYMFLVAGCAFAAAYLLGDQVAFVGVSAAFLGVGAAFVAKGRRAKRTK